MKNLKKIGYKEFIKVNEFVANTSPMMTHYHSNNPLERKLWRKKKNIIKDLFNDISPKNILDLGCGDGGLIDIIPPNVAYHGIDISPTQIALARKHIKKIGRKNATIEEGDILDLKIKSNSYDAILLCDVIEHVLDPDKLLREAKRITKDGGYIILGIPNESLWELTRLALLRFPLRSPDHINAIYPSDIYMQFRTVLKKVFIPMPFSSHLSLIHIYLVKNEK
jgi:ubiquinone/menaquinone biosynthesis C-methylase UbiE